MNYNQIEENDINIEGLKDPIPFLYCGKDISFSYNKNGLNEILFLDPNGHRVKYGMDKIGL